MAQTEDALREQVLRNLKALPGSVWFTYPRTRFASSGVSDVIGCYKGRFVAIELKLDLDGGYGLTRLQANFLRRINECSGIGIVADSWEKIRAELEVI